MSDSYNYRLDIRFAVFIIWALLFVVFIVFPISIIYVDHLIQRLGRCIGCTCWGCIRPDNPDESDNSRLRGTYYSFLSGSQKMEIKRLRKEMIQRCLERYSVWMVIGKDTRLLKDEEADKVPEANEYGDSTADVNTKVNKSLQTDATDVESQFEDEDNAQFSHLSIPYPGYDLNGVHTSALVTARKKKADQTETKKRFGFISKLWNDEKKDKTEPEPEPVAQSNVVIQLDEKRTASKFCAICLASYEPYDKISWSSNGGCTHVFHNECILTWLSTLGDKWSRQQRFTEDLGPGELLGYELECPCCRQEFVSRDVVCTCCDEEEADVHDLERPVVSEHSI